MNTLIISPKKSRVLYRINKDKLNKYHSENNLKHINENLTSNIEEKKLFPIIQLLSNKIIDRKHISIQTTTTTFNNESINTLSIVSKSKLKIIYLRRKKTQIFNYFLETSELDISNSLSSSLFHTNSSNIELNFSDKSSIQSKQCRIYIRSIIRHMFDDDIFNEN